MIEQGRTIWELTKVITLKRLKEFNGNRTHTSESLGISIRTLRDWIERIKKEDGVFITRWGSAYGENISIKEEYRRSAIAKEVDEVEELSLDVYGMPSNEERISYKDNPEKTMRIKQSIFQ